MNYKPEKHQDKKILKLKERGQSVVRNPLLNKGTAFTKEDREKFFLDGILPPHISTLEEQLERTWESLKAKPDAIEKYIYLRSLQDRNETLYYALLVRHVRELMPIIYTPTVGDAVIKYGHIYRIGRGLFITPENVDRMDELVKALPSQDIDIMVVTDNEGILGIGDQGAGGMGIPIGKLSIYTLAGGIHPSTTLPVSLDVGTNNETLLNDPLYLGRREKRLRGEEYETFIQKFVEGIHRNFPHAVLQWEDFSKQNAYTINERYKKVHPSFNDDIEGTGAVALAGAMRAVQIKGSSLSEQSFLIQGAGAAGIGIATAIKSGLVKEGLSEQEALKHIIVTDSKGILYSDRNGLDDYKKLFARDRKDFPELNEHSTLAEIVREAKVTVFIGVSAQKGSITPEIVEIMSSHTDRPVIFPLSNPTSLSEADPRELLKMTNGKAIVASGSPFDDVEVNGKTYTIPQGNNAFIFPGVGLGAILSKAREIRSSLLASAAFALADYVRDIAQGSEMIYPPIENITVASRRIAKAVFETAIVEGLSPLSSGTNFDALADDYVWEPVYPEYIAD